MTDRQSKKIPVTSVDFYDGARITDLIGRLQKALDRVPLKCREAAQFDIKIIRKNYIEVSIHYMRTETDEELNKRTDDQRRALERESVRRAKSAELARWKLAASLNS